jgi:hypothetical protein
MAQSVDVSALATTLGDYCREYSTELLESTLLELPSREDMTLMDGVVDEIVLTELVSEKIVKPYKDAFEPTLNALKFKPRILKTRACKVDLQLKVKALHKTWLGMVKRPGADAYNLPFEAFLMNRIIKQAKDDIENDGIYSGVYDADGDTPADTMSGFFTLLEASVTASEITPTDITALTNGNAVAQFELLVANIPSKYLKENLKLFVSAVGARYYSLDYRARYGALPYNKEFEKVMIDGTMIEIVAQPSIVALDKFFIAPESNLFIGVDTEGDLENLVIEKEKRNINVMMDFNIGVNYGQANKIWYAKVIP